MGIMWANVIMCVSVVLVGLAVYMGVRFMLSNETSLMAGLVVLILVTAVSLGIIIMAFLNVMIERKKDVNIAKEVVVTVEMNTKTEECLYEC